ncbi:outer membrane lipoprotein LolB [Massilia forsythiae]|uniref:outer membrane lipoprotein LolB n=1 Tax=Massilia forsythiae TaxID=2728020 RepID=UPI001E40D1D2|nr:outer membrane lipoprotein LolB [Massilia forsythiae]
MPIRILLPRSRRVLPALAVAAMLGMTLAGCATGTARLSNPAAVAGAYRDTIDLGGRITVTYQKDGQPQRIIGNFTWAQRPGNIDVALMSQLGQTLARINVTPQTATLTQSGREPRVAKDIDGLTRQALGWSLPVAGLSDWLQGYATDAGGKRFTASPANNTVFTSDGWNLRFVEWQDGARGSGGPCRASSVPTAAPPSRATSWRYASSSIR